MQKVITTGSLAHKFAVVTVTIFCPYTHTPALRWKKKHTKSKLQEWRANYWLSVYRVIRHLTVVIMMSQPHWSIGVPNCCSEKCMSEHKTSYCHFCKGQAKLCIISCMPLTAVQ